jgi:hypothetical protein
VRFAWLAIAFFSCAATSYDGATFKRDKLSYQTGRLGPEWKRIRVEDANLAFKHQNGGAIVCNAICGDNDIRDVPLDVLINQSLFGVEDQNEISREALKLDSRAAVRTHVSGTLDGVSIDLDLVVMKKDNCTFDFQLVTTPGTFAARQPDFEQFFQGFRKISGEQ